ncbi:MAG: hypothetical protein H7099_15860 [Gemmatimonadaceae bacterium]|nr:hypothetical protein [Gemmatimonadaceae bacterium]
MALHTLKVTSTARSLTLRLESPALWVRGPGRTLSVDSGSAGVRVDITDKVIAITRAGESADVVTLVLDVATVESLLMLVITCDVDGRLMLESMVEKIELPGLETDQRCVLRVRTGAPEE